MPIITYSADPVTIEDAKANLGLGCWQIDMQPFKAGVQIAADEIPAHPAFELMRESCKHHKQPLQYITDFTLHDRAALYNWQPREFVWVLRDAGTHIVLAGAEWQRVGLEYYVRQAQASSYDHIHFYTYQHGELLQVEPEEALIFLDNVLKHVVVQEKEGAIHSYYKLPQKSDLGQIPDSLRGW